MTLLRFADNPAFIESERLIRQVHVLNAQGKGASDEAVAIQEADEGPWLRLNPEERARIHGLSADLYMLTGQEIHEPTDLTQDQLKAALQDAWRRDDAVQMLSLLRKGPVCLTKDQIAYFRGKYYRALGQKETALLFLEYAAKSVSSTYLYRMAWLEMMVELGCRDEARRMARDLVHDKKAHPYLHIHAGSYLIQELLRTAQQDGAQWQEVLAVLKSALKEETSLPASQRYVKGRVLGLIVLGLCYQRTGHRFLTQETFADACTLDPTLYADLAAVGRSDRSDDDLVSCFRQAEADLSHGACAQAEASAMSAA